MLWGLKAGNWRKARVFVTIAVLVCSSAPVYAAASSKGLPTAEEIDSILQEISRITGFRVRKQLSFASITRDQVNRYVTAQIRRSIKPREIRAEETTMKKFGFAPPDFDLKQTTIDLLTEQAAAFYDYKKKKLYISNWAAVNMRDAALIHELAHALVDQNFPIRRFLEAASSSSEESLAREAVVEGQASWLMLEVGARRRGKSLADSETARELLAPESTIEENHYPVFDRAPLYVRKTLTFPYEEGEKFQQAVFMRMGAAGFARVFMNPPISTAEIEHPEQYFEDTVVEMPELPKPPRRSKPLVTGQMGELETRILLQQYLGESAAQTLGPELRGAAYRIDESDHGHRLTLVYASEWANEKAAAEYLSDYRIILQKKWKWTNSRDESGSGFDGESEDGYFQVVRDGNRVISREGFEHPL